MNFIDGTQITRLGDKVKNLSKQNRKRAMDRILHRVAEAYGRQLLYAGLFQADGHPGNILVMKGEGQTWLHKLLKCDIFEAGHIRQSCLSAVVTVHMRDKLSLRVVSVFHKPLTDHIPVKMDVHCAAFSVLHDCAAAACGMKMVW